MKSILAITILIFLFSLHTFPQDRNIKEYLPNRMTPEKNQEIFKLKSDGYAEFYNEDSRTTINKIRLKNGFLSIN